MAKIIHVIRHGEAAHDVNNAALRQRDTALTAKGQRQAASLQARLLAMQPEVVLTSPILRALQTTAGCLHPACKTPVVVVPDSREFSKKSSHLCEMPLAPTSESASSFASYDWTMVEAAVKQAGSSVAKWEAGLQRADRAWADVDKRSAALSKLIEERPEKTLCLVSHGGFLQRLTGDEYMDNCELRSYSLDGGKWCLLDPWAGDPVAVPYAHLPKIAPNLYIGNRYAARRLISAYGRCFTISAVKPVGVKPDKEVYFEDGDGTGHRETAKEERYAQKMIVQGSNHLKAALDTKQRSPVLVHCWAGQNRSAAIICAYAVSHLGWEPEKAIRYVRARVKKDRNFTEVMQNRAFKTIVKTRLRALTRR